MHAAFLFDTEDEKYDGHNYWWTVRTMIFATGIVQASGRHMKLSVGDVLWDRGRSDIERRSAICDVVFLRPDATYIHLDRLVDTLSRAMVFAVVFENMTEAIALELHRALTPDERYLGFKEVHLDLGSHLVVYRQSLSTIYRLKGRYCRAFFSMSEDDSKDIDNLEAMRELGYDDLDWEDDGARKTIFDDFDTLAHFKQIAAFRAAIEPYMPDGKDGAFELAMVLEDLNPRLFNSLGAAVQTLATAANEEHIAQAALSGRRYMEALADGLFPPKSELRKGRKIGSAEYKNRLWAFIEDNVPPRDDRLALLGKEADRLVDELNGGLHGDRPKVRMQKALADAAIFTASLLALNPEAARKPYLAFGKSIIAFFKGSATRC